MKRTAFAAVLLAMAGLTLFGTRKFHAAAAAVPAPAGTTLKQVATIDLPGPAGKRFDYLTIDYDDGYLLSAHLGAGLLYVIDLKTNKVVMTIPDVPGVEGVEYVPELKKIYTSDWHEKKIGVIDLRQGKVIAKLPAQQKPDGSAPYVEETALVPPLGASYQYQYDASGGKNKGLQPDICVQGPHGEIGNWMQKIQR